MPTFDIEGTIVRRIVARTEQLAALKFRQDYGATPTYVGTKEVVGGCETCPTVILEGDPFRHDGDGAYWCIPCFGSDSDLAVVDAALNATEVGE